MSTALLWAALTILVILGWLRIRSRLRRQREAQRLDVDDEAVRRILEEGSLRSREDEPLDLEEIEEEERRFWEESWDEPERW